MFSIIIPDYVKIKNYRNSITSVIMWIFPLLGSLMSILTFNKNHLKKKYSVLVIDKARGTGGRSSNRRWKKNLTFILHSCF